MQNVRCKQLQMTHICIQYMGTCKVVHTSLFLFVCDIHIHVCVGIDWTNIKFISFFKLCAGVQGQQSVLYHGHVWLYRIEQAGAELGQAK